MLTKINDKKFVNLATVREVMIHDDGSVTLGFIGADVTYTGEEAGVIIEAVKATAETYALYMATVRRDLGFLNNLIPRPQLETVLNPDVPSLKADVKESPKSVTTRKLHRKRKPRRRTGK